MHKGGGGGGKGGRVQLCLIKQIIMLTLKSSFCLSVAGVTPWVRNTLQIGTFLGMRVSVHLTVNQSGL